MTLVLWFISKKVKGKMEEVEKKGCKRGVKGVYKGCTRGVKGV
jgi:hypothetical protein